jgi:hypothetical protein
MYAESGDVKLQAVFQSDPSPSVEDPVILHATLSPRNNTALENKDDSEQAETKSKKDSAAAAAPRPVQSGTDIYRRMAQHMFRKSAPHLVTDQERSVSKTIVLG